MKFWDYLLTAAIVLVALYYLYRVFAVKKGCACGSSCCSGGSGPGKELGNICQCPTKDKGQP